MNVGEIKRNIEKNNELIQEKTQVENDVIQSIDIILNNLNLSKTNHDS